jgi:hypothetical protein
VPNIFLFYYPGQVLEGRGRKVKEADKVRTSNRVDWSREVI